MLNSTNVRVIRNNPRVKAFNPTLLAGLNFDGVNLIQRVKHGGLNLTPSSIA